MQVACLLSSVYRKMNVPWFIHIEPKYGSYFRSKCRKFSICSNTFYIPLSTAPTSCCSLGFKSPCIEWLTDKIERKIYSVHIEHEESVHTALKYSETRRWKKLYINI
jgi:hypothetical protein